MHVERAPAKLTLSLRITGVRPDGYHEIDAEMVTVDLCDELTFTEGDSLVVQGPHSAAVGPGNLVARALRAVHRQAGVVVRKNIPPGAGLGGGSADAAAVLRWAGRRDVALAVTLGADVPFCLSGGRARVRGIGEVVDALPFVARTFTLLTPPLHCSTPAVYAKWDELGGPASDRGNDLEPAALAVAPDLARWRDELGNTTGQAPALAGSGSTWFVEGSYPDVAGAVVVHTTPPA